VLATSTPADGATARYLLPQGFDAAGRLIFGTNAASQKTRHLETDARCEAVWRDGHRQVRVRGRAVIAGATSPLSQEAYERLTPGCRFGLTMLDQGRAIDESEHARLLRRFDDEFDSDAASTLKCPAHYTQFVLAPDSFEFYQGGHPGYCNDRFLYVRREPDQAAKSGGRACFELHSRLQG